MIKQISMNTSLLVLTLGTPIAITLMSQASSIPSQACTLDDGSPLQAAKQSPPLAARAMVVEELSNRVRGP